MHGSTSRTMNQNIHQKHSKWLTEDKNQLSALNYETCTREDSFSVLESPTPVLRELVSSFKHTLKLVINRQVKPGAPNCALHRPSTTSDEDPWQVNVKTFFGVVEHFDLIDGII